MIPSDETSILKEIIGWLEQERESYLYTANCAGIQPSIQITETVARNVTDTGMQSSHVTRNISPLHLDHYAWRLADKISEPDKLTFPLAERIFDAFGESANVWSFYGSLKFEENPVEYITRTLLGRIRTSYLELLESLEKPDRDLAEKLANDLIQLFQRDSTNFVTALPLAGFRIENDQLISDFAVLRKLTDKELGVFLDSGSRLVLGASRRKILSPPINLHTSERVVLEVSKSNQKLEQPLGNLLAQKMVLALQLLGFSPHGSGYATTWTEPGPSLIDGGQQFRLPDKGEIRECSEMEFRRAAALAQLIPDGGIYNPTTPQEIVLHRFGLGASDTFFADSLIDYVIALEGFLLPSSKYGEYRFKFALFGARYLESDDEARKVLFRRLRDVYDWRSELVHGTAAPQNSDELQRRAGEARDLASAILVKALESGWPGKEEIQNLSI